MSKATIKTEIDANITQNGHNEITGPKLNGVLKDIVDEMMTNNYKYAGVAALDTDPETPSENVFYIATEVGEYENFLDSSENVLSVAEGEVAIFKFNGTSWSKEVTGIASNEKLSELDQEVLENNCGELILSLSVTQIYTQIQPLTGRYIVKVDASTDIQSAILALATGGSASSVTTKILDGEFLSQGSHYYLVHFDGEGYIRCMNGTSSGVGITLNIYDSLSQLVGNNKNGLSALQGLSAEALCGKELESHNISAYYTNIEERSGVVILRVDAESTYNGNLSINDSGTSSGDTTIISTGELQEGVYYYLVRLHPGEKWFRANPIPSNMNISIHDVLGSGINDITPESIGAINQYQNAGNQGKALLIGADGYVYPGHVQGGVVISGLERADSKTLYLGNDLLNGNTPTLTGFSGNIASGLTLAARTRGSIVFDFDTESNAAYLITWDMNTPIFDLFVSIGDEPAVDSYRDEVGHVGIVSKGGSLRLEVIGTSNASDVTITNLKMRKVVTEQESTSTYTYACGNIDFGKTGGIDDFWNIAIGTPDVMSSMQNGSRNIAIGKSAAQAFKSGTRNIAIGTFAQAALESGDYNISIGADNFWKFKKGRNNVSVGMTSLGSMALQTFEAENNVAIGGYALGDSGRGSNVVRGNVALGFEAGYKNDRFGTFVGHQAGKGSNGVNNVAIGFSSWTSGTGDNNTIVGAYTSASSYSNCIVIGSQSVASKSNQIVIGRQTHTEVVIAGKKIIFNNDGTVTWEEA